MKTHKTDLSHVFAIINPFSNDALETYQSRGEAEKHAMRIATGANRAIIIWEYSGQIEPTSPI